MCQKEEVASYPETLENILPELQNYCVELAFRDCELQSGLVHLLNPKEALEARKVMSKEPLFPLSQIAKDPKLPVDQLIFLLCASLLIQFMGVGS